MGQLLSEDPTRPFQQTVTTACHHCLDPACLNGCPVLAYEKDPSTGIVHHLDDQCIGCQYCVLKCPYDVPKYSSRLGIVRKCDMCSQRLTAGQAPACVQACPNEAITIELVDRETVRQRWLNQASAFLPDAPDPQITLPTTVYRSERLPDQKAVSNNHSEATLQPPHWPLVIMLVMTQAGAGTWWAGLISLEPLATNLSQVSIGLTALGLLASFPHLGRPLKAWRSFLGWRRSWMSREIMAFSLFVGMALAFVASPVFVTSLSTSSAGWRVGIGLVGGFAVLASGMLYHDTGRPTWLGWRSVGRFFLTSMLLGSAVALTVGEYSGLPRQPWLGTVLTAAAVKLALEVVWLFPLPPKEPGSRQRDPVLVSARLQRTCLTAITGLRLAGALLGIGCLLVVPMVVARSSLLIVSLGCGLLFLSEIAERYAFFRAMVARRMPGV